MMKKGKWSKEEDNLIKSHIEKYGVGRSWQALSNTLGLQRCGRSCRSRWLNYLRPGLKHGNFTPAEETIICEMYSKRGSCWSVIAARLPGRTDLAVKNYWNSTLKKKFPAARASAAHRRRNLAACSTSTDAGTPARDLQLISYSSQESSTPGSSPASPPWPACCRCKQCSRRLCSSPASKNRSRRSPRRSRRQHRLRHRPVIRPAWRSSARPCLLSL
nr:unnamed protein product [Digitaria exilis]